MNLIHNRFENVVIERVKAKGAKWPVFIQNPGLLADAACIALNKLPPHYIRHEVDLSFYMPEDKRRVQEELQVNAAVESALAYVLRAEQVKAPT